MSPGLLLALPVATAIFAAGLAALRLGSRPWQIACAWAGAIAQSVAAVVLLASVAGDGTLAATLGGWPAPYGIALAADSLAAILVSVAAFLNLSVLLQEHVLVPTGHWRRGHAVFRSLLMAGVSGAFLTADLFNLFVWFEVMLMASFALLGLGPGRTRAEGAIKYVVINLMSSALFLTGVGILYTTVGTLNLADLHVRIGGRETEPAIASALGLLLAAFCTKAAVFPLFAWLPSSYHLPEPPVAALFSGLLTKVGVYAIVRLDTLIAPGAEWIGTILVWGAGFTMLGAVLGAAAQSHMRKILSWHVPSQVGYMIMGIAVGTRAALAATTFYLVHHIVVKTALFLAAGSVRLRRGDETLSAGGGLLKSSPWTAFATLAAALSLAGIPPLSGFWAKLLVVREGIVEASWGLVAAALCTGLLTLFSMVKIWNEIAWKDAPSPDLDTTRRQRILVDTPLYLLVAASLVLGLFPGPLWALSERAGAELSDPSGYVRAVLGIMP